MDGIALESVLRRDRVVVVLGLIAITALSWWYLFTMPCCMDAMEAGLEAAMPRLGAWTPVEFWLMFVMWAVMMVAMMVPSAAPMVLTFALVNRKRREQQRPYVPTFVFLLGYLVVWTGFSAVATAVQWGLHTAALMSPHMASTSPVLGAAILIGTGVFQWTPHKNACLTHCRTPLAFFMTDWREGVRGAFGMGLRHGFYCTACCWLLMCLLFVAGVMNMLWVAAITVFVLLEKVLPGGRWVSRVSGTLLLAWGVWMAAGGGR